MSYETSHDHLIDELDRIRELLEYHVEADPLPLFDDFSPSQSASTLDPTDLSLAVPPDVRDTLDERLAEISRHCRETPADTTLRLRVLAEQFDLSRNHLDVLLVAVTPRIHSTFEQLFDSLHDDPAVDFPTVEFVERLFANSGRDRLTAFGLVDEDSPLRRHDLLRVEPVDGDDGSCRALRPSDRLRSYLKGTGGFDTALDDVATITEPETTLDDLRVADHLEQRIETLRTQRDDCLTNPTAEPSVHYFHGREGSEKRRAVDALVDGRLLRGDLDAILAADQLDRFHREARLQDCPVHLTNVSEATRDPGPDPDDDNPSPTADRPTVEEVVGTLSDLQRDLFLTGTDGWTPTSNHDHAPFDLLTFPDPDLDLQREIWQTHADVVAEDVSLDAIASTFNLTQGQIDDAVDTARALADHPQADGGLSRETLVEGCTSQTAEGLEQLATKIEPDADWDDLVLRSDIERKLWEIAARIRHRGTLSDDYGFGERYSRGNGVVTLFAGASGTGKTLSAEVIASMAGMNIYKIDISNVVSKYIGETEQNLELLFDAARDANAILLFDEADAIFGERAGVSDATDRYANVEVNYLLQRIEDYEGVVLLTTNNKSHIDSAFTRRIHQTIDFPRPQPPERAQIWRIVFPEATETADLDYEFLASFEITGGNIRNIAQTASVLAAADDGVVTMEHVVEALQRELDQLGRIYNVSEFGEYSQYLRPSAATVYTDWSESDEEPDSDGDVVGAENGVPAGENGVTPVEGSGDASVEEGEVTAAEGSEVIPETTDTDTQTNGATDEATSSPEATASEVEADPEAGTTAESQVNDLTPEAEHASGAGPDERDTSEAEADERDTDATGMDEDEDEDEEEEVLTPEERIAQLGREADTGSHIDTDADTGSNTTKRDSPEEVVEQFFEHLAAGETEKARELYHTEGRTQRISDTKRQMLKTNTLGLSSFRRKVDRDYRVVLYFEQQSGNDIVPLEYELRPQDREWRIFQMKRRGGSSRR